MTQVFTVEAYREQVNDALDKMAEEDEEQVILVGQWKPGVDISISASAEDYKNINNSAWAKDAFENEDDIRDLHEGNTFFMHTLILPRKHLSEVAEKHIHENSLNSGDYNGE